MEHDEEPQWVPTRALGRAVLVAGFLLFGAVLFGRADLVVLAAPLALSVAIGLMRRPTSTPGLRLSTVETLPVEGGELGATIEVDNSDTAGYDLAVLRVQHSSWLKLADGDRPHVTSVPRQYAAAVELAGPAVRWGRQTLGPASVQAFAADGLAVYVYGWHQLRAMIGAHLTVSTASKAAATSRFSARRML